MENRLSLNTVYLQRIFNSFDVLNSLEKVFSQTSLETTVTCGWVAGKTDNKANLSLIWSWSWVDLGLDRFTLNRFLPIPILTDFETFNSADTDTDSVE